MRLEILKPDAMDARQQEMADRITKRRGAVRGPFQVWINSPEACDRVEALGAFSRFESSLPLRLRELSLLLAARNWDAQYSWMAHVDKAVESGIPRAAVDAIARNEEPLFEVTEDRVFYRFCTELLQTHFVTDETFADALECFGAEGLVDTVASLGNYTMLGMCLNAFQVDLKKDRTPPFPDMDGFHKITKTG